MNVSEEITRMLKSQLNAAEVLVEDDSARHAGHKKDVGGGHYTVVVVADIFQGKPLLERHRLVNDAVFAQLKGRVHALAIRAWTPEEWKRKK